MSSSHISVLTRKIESAKRAAPNASGLEKFTEALEKGLREALSALLDGEIEATLERSGAQLPDALAAAPNPGVYYWLTGENAAPCALCVVSPSFASVLSERLLGGDLRAPNQEAAAGLIDFQMAGVLADNIIRILNQALTKYSSAQTRPTVTARRGVRSPSDAVGGFEPSAATCLSARLAYAGQEAAGAIKLYLPAAFIESAGLDAGGLPALRKQGQDPVWMEKMRRNILNTEIPLCAVLERISTNVGALSKLEVGQVFDLCPEALGNIEISVMTKAGPETVARARLGAVQQNKAIKLTTPIDPAFAEGF